MKEKKRKDKKRKNLKDARIEGVKKYLEPCQKR